MNELTFPEFSRDEILYKYYMLLGSRAYLFHFNFNSITEIFSMDALRVPSFIDFFLNR